MTDEELLNRIDQLCRLAGAASTQARTVASEDSDLCRATKAVYLKAAALRRLLQERA